MCFLSTLSPHTREPTISLAGPAIFSPFAQNGRVCINALGGGQWRPIFCWCCTLHTPHPSGSLSKDSLPSLTCRDSEQIPPPFLALQSAENRHADLRTDRRHGLRVWMDAQGLSPFPESRPSSSNVSLPHLLRPPHPSRHFFSRLGRQTRMFSKLILDLCVLLPWRQLASPPSRSTFFLYARTGRGGLFPQSHWRGAPQLTSSGSKMDGGQREGGAVKGDTGTRVSALPTLRRLVASSPLAIFPPPSLSSPASFPQPGPHPHPFSSPCSCLTPHSRVPQAATKALTLT